MQCVQGVRTFLLHMLLAPLIYGAWISEDQSGIVVRAGLAWRHRCSVLGNSGKQWMRRAARARRRGRPEENQKCKHVLDFYADIRVSREQISLTRPG